MSYKASEAILKDLEWISELDDIDHDICGTALDAIHELKRLERIVAEQKEKIDFTIKELEGYIY
jgi:hypothetical protein